VSSEEIISIMK